MSITQRADFEGTPRVANSFARRALGPGLPLFAACLLTWGCRERDSPNEPGALASFAQVTGARAPAAQPTAAQGPVAQAPVTPRPTAAQGPVAQPPVTPQPGPGNGRRAQGPAPAFGTPDQSAALACFQKARDQTLLGQGNAFLLCRGAVSTAPADCYERGEDETGLTRRELFDLCRCARSTEPVTCFERAERETFLETRQIIQLCSPIVTLNLWPSCFPAAL